jgi:hypothetical protein
MKIYELAPAEGQEWAVPKALKDNDVLSDLRGQRQLHWKPIDMDILTEDEEGAPTRYSDFPWYGSHVLILRSVAAEGLRAIMSPYGEFLPLGGGDGLELFNPTTVLDALDEGRSEVIRFDDGDILNIERHVLRPDVIRDTLMFKLPYRASNLYMQLGFIEQINNRKFCGIGFEPVWSDE